MGFEAYLALSGLSSVAACALGYPIIAFIMFYPIYLTGIFKFIGSLGLGNGGGADNALSGLFVDALILVSTNGAYFYYAGKFFG